MPDYPRACHHLPLEQLKELEEQLKHLTEKGYIVPSNAPTPASAFLAKKKDASLRVVIDYRALNAITIKTEYPLPRISDLLDRIGTARWFSTLDLQSGYHQVAIPPEDQWKTACRTRYGVYNFVVMPFGLAGAPGTFQRLMQEVFIEELDELITVYLGDVLVYSKIWPDHVQHLSKTFEKLRQHGPMLKRKKWCFAKERVTYLGFVIGAQGIRPNPQKARTIMEWPEALENRQQIRAFLRMVGYHRRLIPNFIVGLPTTSAATRRRAQHLVSTTHPSRARAEGEVSNSSPGKTLRSDPPRRDKNRREQVRDRGST